MAMSARFREVCTLLIQGTGMGRLSWEPIPFLHTYSTRLGQNLITVGLEIGEGPPDRPDVFRSWRPSLVRLRVLSDDGDELETATEFASDGSDDYDRLLDLWKAAHASRQQFSDDRLRGLADALRATVNA